MQMLCPSHFKTLPPNPSPFSPPIPPVFPISPISPPSTPSNLALHLSISSSANRYRNPFAPRSSKSIPSERMDVGLGLDNVEIDRFVEIGNKVADAAGEVIRKYFRKKFDIIDKDDLSPVTIADRAAEESMSSIILENFPSHAIYGEENGWRCKEKSAEYVWVLDPIDGTKSFITGKPLFGTLIALLYKGKPIVGIIDQPILRERWIGMSGRRTTLNGQEVSTRTCSKLSQAYLYTTSPHLFSGDAEEAFARVRSKVKVPLYGCDCYAYALLASGYVDLVIESGLKVSTLWQREMLRFTNRL
ncbi:bifunctional phosphatase IMPL2, chloroplastic isoform X2 [Magnolia sinica]|uniref:bifunctional phosphatase IMPL2, chloroplastic isoform X2 n=1 Tax=Magnolia sinica TaxID=86752 RepID=UPI00265A7E2B|nr:bifunctional phosphatase IMPL2, chloroplastic isoform X2 [Magnolia sinica]XP_058091975.1 bifunctional phosphatase IMPL2, chloroplastic isoform X2 [Magnolia sinica]XP_058091976.1 bifunctional phosphatase IMPL2, chloroplastic isoform X2 [Magnolia sinica]